MVGSVKLMKSYKCYDEYESISDEELVEEIKDGDDNAEKYLYMRYTHSVKKIVGSFFINGGEKEDLFQEAMIGMINAVKKYNSKNNVCFKAFAEICMKRQIISAIRKSQRHKYGILNNSVSLNQCISEDDDRSILDKWTCSDLLNPENLIVNKEREEILNKMTNEILSKLEKDVLAEYITGKTYQEIAVLLNKNVKSVDNAIQRIKKKIQSTMKN